MIHIELHRDRGFIVLNHDTNEKNAAKLHYVLLMYPHNYVF